MGMKHIDPIRSEKLTEELKTVFTEALQVNAPNRLVSVTFAG
jgi:hypothetical protein